MNKRSIILLVIAALIAGLVMLGLRGNRNAPPPQEVVGTKILVASSTIPAGTFVQADKSLKWVDWPQANVQPWNIVQGARPAEEFNGAVARRNIQPGEAITDELLVKPGQGGFMSAVLSPGMRAVSIAVTPTSSNAGFIFPGDRVDLIVTHRVNLPAAPGEAGNQTALVSETFVENTRVVAIDQMLDNPENKAIVPKTVTLEVTSKQAEAINVATDMGKISIALRSLGSAKQAEAAHSGDDIVDPFLGDDAASFDEGPSLTRDSDVSRAIGGTSRAYPRVQVFRGEEVQQMQFK